MSYAPYPVMKDNKIPWLGSIPAEWDVKALRYIAKPIIGLTYSPTDVVGENEGTLVLRASNIQNGKISLHDNVFVAANIPDKLRIKAGDILVCSRNGSRHLIGKNALILEDHDEWSFGAFTTVIRSEYGPFLYWVMNSRMFEYQSGRFLTTTINQLTTGVLNSFEIPFPSVEEQTAIADFLDKKTAEIDGLIAKKEELLRLLAEQRTALITHAVTKGLNPNTPMKSSGIDWLGDVPEGWDVKPLKFLGRFQNGISIGGDSFGSGFPFVSYGDVYKNISLPETGSGLVESTAKDRVLYSVERGDIFFTRTSETIEEIAISSVCQTTIPDAVFAGFLIRCRPYPNRLNVGFSKYYFRNSRLRDYFVKEMNLVTRASLGQTLLGNLMVALPPLEEQEHISVFLDEKLEDLAKVEADAQKSIHLLKEYRTSIITSAVTGKIKVA